MAAVFDDTYDGPRWAFGLTHRPPGYAHNPEGWIVDAIRPASCPCVPFGILEYPRQLTAREIASYELVAMDGHHCPEACAVCNGQKDFSQTCQTEKCPNGTDEAPAFSCDGWGGLCCVCGDALMFGAAS